MFTMRNLVDVINEAIQSTPVKSSHISKVEHTGDHLYITFYTGDIYEYDGVPEKQAAQMLRQDSKGKYFWKFIRNPGKPGGGFDYRKVAAIPKAKPHYKWNWKTETWEPMNDEAIAQSSNQTQSTDPEVPREYAIDTPDGNHYVWKGAQWVSTVTGRVAKRDVGKALTAQAHQDIQGNN